MNTEIVALFGCHSVVSVSLTILNKKIVADFPFPWCTVLLQCSASVCILLVLDRQVRRIGPIRREHLPSALLVSSLFMACLTSSFFGLRRVHVPMVVVGKNLTPFCTAILEALVLQTSLGLRKLAPLVLTILGGVIYAYGDMNTEARGVSYVMLNSAIVAVTSVSEKRVISQQTQTPLGWSLYRNALAVPVLSFLILCGIEDFGEARRSLIDAGQKCWSLLVLSAFFSAAAGFLIFKLQTKVSATATQVANLCYKICTTLVSLAVFPESRRDTGLLAFVGYTMSMVGIALYVLPSNFTKDAGKASVKVLAASAAIASVAVAYGPGWSSTEKAPDQDLENLAGVAQAGRAA